MSNIQTSAVQRIYANGVLGPAHTGPITVLNDNRGLNCIEYGLQAGMALPIPFVVSTKNKLMNNFEFMHEIDNTTKDALTVTFTDSAGTVLHVASGRETGTDEPFFPYVCDTANVASKDVAKLKPGTYTATITAEDGKAHNVPFAHRCSN